MDIPLAPMLQEVEADDELSKDVVELQVLNSGNFEQAYVSFPYQQQDFSTTSSLEFQVLDQQGENTVYITLVDDFGASWSGWSSDEAKQFLIHGQPLSLITRQQLV